MVHERETLLHTLGTKRAISSMFSWRTKQHIDICVKSRPPFTGSNVNDLDTVRYLAGDNCPPPKVFASKRALAIVHWPAYPGEPLHPRAGVSLSSSQHLGLATITSNIDRTYTCARCRCFSLSMASRRLWYTVRPRTVFIPPRAANQVAYRECDGRPGRRRVRWHTGFGILVSETNRHPLTSTRAPVATSLSSVHARLFVVPVQEGVRTYVTSTLH